MTSMSATERVTVDPHDARLDKYGWTVNRDNVRAIIEQIADYPEILAAANLLAQPTADEAEGDEREVLARVINGASDPDLPVRLFTPGVWATADRVLAAGFRRRDPDAGLRERVEALHGGTHWCFGFGDGDQEAMQAEVFEPGTEWWPCPTLAALAADTPTPAPEGSETGGAA